MEYTSNLVRVNKINLHYLEFGNKNNPKLLLMHGLTANAHAFDGFIAAGLAKKFHVISVDLRGRGLSDKPAFSYSIEEHANDIIALLDQLEISKIDFCGHSFGGLLSTHIAYNHTERVRRLVILDAAPQMNPRAAEMLGPALSRLTKRFNSFEEYIDKVKSAPYNTFWDDNMLSYYSADVHLNDQGTLQTRSNLADITQIAINTSKEPWGKYFEDIPEQALLIHAVENYTLDQPLLLESQAKLSVSKMINGHYFPSNGNHQTMLYGDNAKGNVKAIIEFLA